MKAILIVLDSVGIGAAPDASDYGDVGSATIQHTADAVGGINLTTLQKLGLGNIPEILPDGLPIKGCPSVENPMASFGAMREVSEGKDTITGHWEMAGIKTKPGFHLFPDKFPCFPNQLVEDFEKLTGRKLIGNKHANGVNIINELGEDHMKSGAFICYSSADSVFQIAANVEHTISLDELYEACKIARKLCDPLKVGRVIARPFKGTPGNFERTEDRRDFAYSAETPFITEKLVENGVAVYAVGKIEDIIAKRGISESNHTGNTEDSQKALEDFMECDGDAFIWANFIDFDMLYGHRRDPIGYAAALEQTDNWLSGFIKKLGDDDILMITADHGNDPTFKGSDHTREFVPLIIYGPNLVAKNLGIRDGFFDIAQTLTSIFKVEPNQLGESCI